MKSSLISLLLFDPLLIGLNSEIVSNIIPRFIHGLFDDIHFWTCLMPSISFCLIGAHYKTLVS
jgi:hypothetical protein